MNQDLRSNPGPGDVVRDYYAALRAGKALPPYFGDSETVVKFGIGESLYGIEAVTDALREQTATTSDWTVESHALRVDARDDYALFADEVTMAWTDGDGGKEHRFETRWSGTLDRVEGGEPPWQFVSMHVSAPDSL